MDVLMDYFGDELRIIRHTRLETGKPKKDIKELPLDKEINALPLYWNSMR